MTGRQDPGSRRVPPRLLTASATRPWDSGRRGPGETGLFLAEGRKPCSVVQELEPDSPEIRLLRQNPIFSLSRLFGAAERKPATGRGASAGFALPDAALRHPPRHRGPASVRICP